jgi:integrase
MSVKVRFHKCAWWIFIHHCGRRKAKKIGDRATALDVACKIRQRFAEGDLGLLKSEPDDAETFRRYGERWLEGATGHLKASTVRFYRGHLEQHIFPALGSRVVGSIRRADCRDLVTACRAKELRLPTVRGIARTLSVVLSQAVEDEILPANPALRLGKYLRRGDEPEAEPDPFTREEAELLAAVAGECFPEWYPWVLTGLRTGLRAGELLGLQWGDIDWRGRFVQVQRSLVRGLLTTPKNHQRRRVDLSPQLRAELRRWRGQQSASWLARGRPRPVWVFSSTQGIPLDEANVRKAFNQILDRASLHRRGPHQMRHTFASLLLQAGVPITYVSRQLGHRDSSITLRVYAHWLPDAAAERGVDRLDTDATERNPGATKVREAVSGRRRRTAIPLTSAGR